MDGRGVDKDFNTALRWMTLAAEQGNTGAMINIGLLHQMEVLPGSKGVADAVPWIRKAAELGSPIAQAKLGVFLAWGLGVDADREQAIHWLTLAAKQGNDAAKEFLRGQFGVESI